MGFFVHSLETDSNERVKQEYAVHDSLKTAFQKKSSDPSLTLDFILLFFLSLVPSYYSYYKQTQPLMKGLNTLHETEIHLRLGEET